MLVYCDPPYENQKQISRIKFDHTEFWDTMRQWAKSNTVVISEYYAPDDFRCVLEMPTKTDIRNSSGRLSRIERLFQIDEAS